MDTEHELLLNDRDTEDESQDGLSARTYDRDQSNWEADFAREIESLRLTECDGFFTSEAPLTRQVSRRSLSKTLILPKQTKSSTKNFSFSAFQAREIERQNLNLLRRIKWAKPIVNTNRGDVCSRQSGSAAINAKKKQHEVDRDNLILLRKLKTIANRKKKAFS